MNQSILVGRLTKDAEVKELPNGKMVTEITLAVQRSFKNQETLDYDTDFIKCSIWQGLAINTAEYCKKGSMIGVRGRLATRKIQIDVEKNINTIEFIVEGITFLQSK
jgi:single-strand DNA-binding protein